MEIFETFPSHLQPLGMAKKHCFLNHAQKQRVFSWPKHVMTFRRMEDG